MKSNLKRVFIHEIGHLVAHNLTHKHYGFGEVESIYIDEFEVHGVTDYQGRTLPKVPPGKTRTDLKVYNLPQFLSQLIYGCYFQSLYLEEEYEKCFDGKHGALDRISFRHGIQQYSIDDVKRKELYKYMGNYFNELKGQGEMFKSIFDIDPNDYLLKEGVQIRVDLEKLNGDLKNFFEQHSEKYKLFVEQLIAILG